MKDQILKFVLFAFISIAFFACKKDTISYPDWITYRTKNSGLISDVVYTIAIDQNGDKWIGTWKGASKFDGTHWINFTTSNSGLEGNWVNTIAIDSNGNKWLMTSDNYSTQPSGLIKFDNFNWTKIDSSNSNLSGYDLYYISTNSKGDVWFGGSSGEVSKFDGSNWTSLNLDVTDNTTWMTCIAADAENLWVGTNKGLSVSTPLDAYFILTIAIDPQGDKWFGTDKGVWKYDGNTWTKYTTANSGLVNDYVLSIAIDNKDNKWFGTRQGVSKFNGVTWISYNTSNSGLKANTVNSIAIDEYGNKWFGTLGGGISEFSGD